MTGESGRTRRTPFGIVLVSLLLVLYGSLWLLSLGLGGLTGNRFLTTIALPIGLTMLLLASLLYRQNFVAWVITLVVVAVSTSWRLARVLGGRTDDLSNAIVGLVIVAYLLATREFFQPAER